MFPYIGICDVPSRTDAQMYAEYFDEHSRNIFALYPLRLMVGVMMSYKTLNGLPSSWTSVWPQKEKISDIFIDHHRVINTIHYADFKGDTTLEHLCQVREYGGSNLDAIQLDMVWPNPDMIKKFRERFPEIKIVLQVNRIALDQQKNNPSSVVLKLAQYDDSVNCALFDKSHGTGTPLKSSELLPFLRETRSKLPDLSLAVAGGLGPFSLSMLELILCEFPFISIDAQGRLRTNGDAKYPINKDFAKSYIRNTFDLFQIYNTIS